MPVNEFQLAAGAVAKATMQASTTYNILNFTVQSDQSLGYPWTLPTIQSAAFRVARLVRTADGNTRPDGAWRGRWHFTFMTWGQLAYLDTLLGWSNTVWSASATVQGLDTNGAWQVWQVIAHRPDPEQMRKATIGGWLDVVIEFTDGVLL